MFSRILEIRFLKKSYFFFIQAASVKRFRNTIKKNRVYEGKKMQLTIDLPNIWSSEKIFPLIERIEQIFIKENVSFEIKTALPAEPDPWDNLDIEKISIDTGIKDFAQNHDYYLYGTPKK